MAYINERTQHTRRERLKNLWKLFFERIAIEDDLTSVSTYI
jgi:hypothetical protein